MYQNNGFLMVIVAYWLCLVAVFGAALPNGPLQSHITGGYKAVQTRNSKSDLDCSQFSSDLDVLDHFPFYIMINPINADWQKSTATTNTDGTLVISLHLSDENAVPLSIFCLENLRYLIIQNTPFPDGIVPDNLKNLRQLSQLSITNSPIRSMTEQLGTLRQLNLLYLRSCLLTHLPDLSGLQRLSTIYLDKNRLYQVVGLTNVNHLYLDDNFFTEIPTLKTPASLQHLSMNNNPVRNMLKITSCINLDRIYLRNTTLSYVPPTIDRLQNLQRLDLSQNKLSHLPTNMLKLSKLIYLNIRDNIFSPADLEIIDGQFKQSLPNMTLVA